MKILSSRSSRSDSAPKTENNKRPDNSYFVPPQIARHPEESSWISKPSIHDFSTPQNQTFGSNAYQSPGRSVGSNVQVIEQSQAPKTYFAEYTRMTLTPEQQAALERVVNKAATQRVAESNTFTGRTSPFIPPEDITAASNWKKQQSRQSKPVSKPAQPKRMAQSGRGRMVQPSQPGTAVPQSAISRTVQSGAGRTAQAARTALYSRPGVYSRPGARKKTKNKSKSIAIALALLFMLSGSAFFAWYFWWTNYATFDYQLQPVVILEGQGFRANEFLSSNELLNKTSATFRNAGFRPTVGTQSVYLNLSRGWRSVDAVASLHVLKPVQNVNVEFSKPIEEPIPVDFISNPTDAAGVSYNLSFVQPPKPFEEYEVGIHTLQLVLNDAPFEVTLNVTDNTPPTAKAVPVTIVAGETVKPTDFVTDVEDPSGIASIEYYETEPKLLSDYPQIVEIIITDTFGNYDIFRSELTVKMNQEPPVIEGAEEIVAMVGNPIIYSMGLTASDDFGRDLTNEIEIDSSGVDTMTVGEYKVLFSVTDASMNRTEIAVDVHVIDIDIEYVHARVDEVLFGRWGILRDGMTQLQQVQAIFTWVKNNIYYAPAGRPHTAEEGAYRALRDRRGNCYNYYSLSAVMLDRAEIPNIRIERIPGTPTRHRWNLVNPDGLGWHHYDSVPTNLGQGLRMAFFTDTQAQEFTAMKVALSGVHNYYTYNPANYPEVVK